MTVELISKNSSFGGSVEFYQHPSTSCQSLMKFSLYRPPQAALANAKLPVLFWLSGLTCNEENFMAKAGAQKYAAEHGLILVAPDTSPRDLGIEGETDSWDFAAGAGFYVNATEAPWQQNYQMYDYVVDELYSLVAKEFPVDINRVGIFGHSMGGHGALTIAFKNPQKFKSVSAFAPICAPTECPWGQKAFTGYLGNNLDDWANYDAHLLIASTQCQATILIDQGSDDNFLVEQLKPERLIEAALKVGYPINYRLQSGYDHSYYFIASFMQDHIQHHLQQLNK